MSSFLNNLIQRHTQASEAVMPRLPGIFESRPMWSTPGMGLEEQAEEVSPPQFHGNPKSPERRPNQEGYKHQDLNSTIHVPVGLSKERDNEKESSPAITNNIRINKFEKVEQPVVPLPSNVENKQPAKEENKIREDRDLKKELDEVLARLKGMKVLHNEQKKEMQKPDVGRMFPDFHKDQVEYSKEHLTRKDSSTQAQPVIKIHIGKIEIKAEKEPQNRVKEQPVTKPALSLDQYLKERKVSHE